MTDRELMQQPQRTHWEGCDEVHPECKQPEQEPVAWIYRGNLHPFDPSDWAVEPVTPLYTSPPRREWVGLTGEEIDQGLVRTDYAMQTAGAWRDGVEWAQAQLREKNA